MSIRKKIIRDEDINYWCGYQNGKRDQKEIDETFDNIGEKTLDYLAEVHKKMGDFNFNTDFQLGWVNCFEQVKKFVREIRTKENEIPKE